MRLDDLDPSSNVRDLGSGGGGGGGFPLLGLLPLLFGRRMGCGGIGLLVVVGLAYLLLGGGGLGSILGGGQTGAPTQRSAPAGAGTACDTTEELFSCRVLTSTEQVWGRVFAASGQQYRAPTLNFYQRGVQSGCGAASSAAGPFYCPSDQGIFLDTSFFAELQERFGAKGDFAVAYVIAHEVGHHIQNLTGDSARVQQIQRSGDRAAGNAASVKLELQADCFAGVWGKLSGRMEPGDIEEGLTAANAIGDDTLQRKSGGEVVPDSFTHGSSVQRMQWLKRGLETGDPAACNTFAG